MAGVVEYGINFHGFIYQQVLSCIHSHPTLQFHLHTKLSEVLLAGLFAMIIMDLQTLVQCMYKTCRVFTETINDNI